LTSIVGNDGNGTEFNLHASQQGTSGMIGACAFTEVALETSTEDFAAKETFKTQASLGDLVNITHNLGSGRIAEDGSLLNEQRAPSVCMAFAILGRQQILIVQIVRAQ
jgi:hypothetical protein